jgi:hypothetical protein
MKITGKNTKVSFGDVSQQAADIISRLCGIVRPANFGALCFRSLGLITLRYAGLFNYPIPLRFACEIGVSRIKFLSKNFLSIALTVLLIFTINATDAAAGLFGPPQTVSKEAGGLNTAIGYWYHEDTYTNGADHIIRQNEVYSQVAYGAKNIWEIYARIGVSDLKIFDVFSSTNASTTTDKNNFEENWKFFGTLGAKGFYPINKTFGIGAFIQGTYYFSNFTDDVAGTNGITPFTTDLKVKNLFDVNFGVGFQATVPYGIKLYAGPYIYYSEAKVSLAANIPGLEYAAGNVSIENKSIAGGFAGIDIPLAKGFRLNFEGQYSDRFSAGAAVTYTY